MSEQMKPGLFEVIQDAAKQGYTVTFKPVFAGVGVSVEVTSHGATVGGTIDAQLVMTYGMEHQDTAVAVALQQSVLALVRQLQGVADKAQANFKHTPISDMLENTPPPEKGET